MNFTKEQTIDVLSKFSSEKKGLNSFLEIVLESLMRSEREEFLSESENNKANGYRLGKVFGHGSLLELKIPRDRLSEFQPLILALYREEERLLQEVAFKMYSKGLTTRDVSSCIETIYGKSYCKSKISKISKSFYKDLESWRNRELDNHYLAFFIDGMFVNLKRDGKYGKECFYIILGLKEDGSREIVSIVNFPTEGSSSWELIFDEIKNRGVNSVGIIVSDSLSGIEKSIAKKFKCPHQKCIVHLKRNLMAQVRADDKKEICRDLNKVLNVDCPEHTIDDAINNFDIFKSKWGAKFKTLNKYLNKLEITSYLSFLNYTTDVRRMLYTTNWIERFNKSARRTLKIRGAFPDDESVLALITSVAREMGEGTYKYPIYKFRDEIKLKRQNI